MDSEETKQDPQEVYAKSSQAIRMAREQIRDAKKVHKKEKESMTSRHIAEIRSLREAMSSRREKADEAKQDLLQQVSESNRTEKWIVDGTHIVTARYNNGKPSISTEVV